MCANGDVVLVRVKVLAELSHEGVDVWKVKPIDQCISSLVKALQEGGVDMQGSCCGHGKSPGEIILANGQKLIIRKWTV